MMLANFLSHSPPCLLIRVRIGLWTWSMLIWLSWLAGMEGPKLLLCSQSVSPPPTPPPTPASAEIIGLGFHSWCFV